MATAAFPERLTRRQSQRRYVSRLVLTHESRHAAAWLIFDVSQMKVLPAGFVLIVLTGCATKQVRVPASASPPLNEQRTLEQRIRALDDYLAESGMPPVPSEVVSPSLTQEALLEVSKRIPRALKKEAQVRFVSDRLAIVFISYTLANVTTPRTQEVQFLFDGHVWNMFWISDEKKG